MVFFPGLGEFGVVRVGARLLPAGMLGLGLPRRGGREVPGESGVHVDSTGVEKPSNSSAFPGVQRVSLKSFPSWQATH